MTRSITQATLLLLALIAGLSFTTPGTTQVFADRESAFYLQINLDAMRASEAGSQLYGWAEKEIISDIESEFEVAVAEQLTGISLFGFGPEQHPVVLLHGQLNPATVDEITGKLMTEVHSVTEQSRGGQTWYEITEIDGDDIELDFTGHGGDEHDQLFLSFGNAGQTLITPSRNVLDDFLDSGGALARNLPEELIVIEAANPLMQGGVDTRGAMPGKQHWESQLFRNVQQAALAVSAEGDALSIEALTVSATPELAIAMQNLIQGLISLHALSGDTDPEATALLGNLTVNTEDNVTRFGLKLPADTFVGILD